MKFFTPAWWGNSADDLSVFDRYRAYIASVSDSIPPGLLDLHSNHTLHDAEVTQIISSSAQRAVTIRLQGWDVQFQNPTSYELRFSEVELFEQIFPGKSELGDLGYWEIETVEEGTEVRMLFVSDAEFRIVFKDFAFRFSPSRA